METFYVIKHLKGIVNIKFAFNLAFISPQGKTLNVSIVASKSQSPSLHHDKGELLESDGNEES